MVKVGIVGCSGFVGMELLRLIKKHPLIEVVALSSYSHQGIAINEVYPSSDLDLIITSNEKVIALSEVVFVAIPSGASQDIAYEVIKAGKICIDLGFDYRIKDEASLKKWHNQSFKYPDLNKQAVYGLSELNEEEIKTANLIANPGCYPTAITLGLAPIIKMVDHSNIVIDAKSGLSGAGKELRDNLH
ncbi:MAG: N-acetyl-gamma-glutamyl-phosphate reductase, partial [Bacilli bacterium]